MKKFIIPALFATAIMTSCGNDAIKAGDEKEVIQQETNATYATVNDGTHVVWRAWHLGKTGDRFGKVMVSEATASTKNDMLTNGKFVLDITSLTVENFGDDTASSNDLSGHLKTGHFFLTDSFPTATFEITSVDTTSGDFNSTVNGNLTIKGVTKSISFNANVAATDDMLSINSEDFEVDRRDWNLTYNEAGTPGVADKYIIHDNIGFTINVNLSK